MYVEAFHHTLKYLYIKDKINQHVHRCVHLVMKIAKDKAFERLIKLEKGMTSYQTGIINSRHVHSIKLSIPLHQNLKTTTPSKTRNNLSKLLYTMQGMQHLYT